jgi:hypothetical protein
MRRQFQILLSLVCVLLSAFTTPTVAEGHRTSAARFSKISFVLERRSGAPQTPSRKRRNVRNRRRASTPPNSKPQSVPTQSTGSTQQTSTGSPSQGALSQVAYELPLRKPGAGEQRVQGFLTDVACDAKGVTFKITVNDRLLKLWTPDLNNVQFATYTPEVSGEITCGTRRTPNHVVVVFRPSKTPNTKFDGTPVSIEFVPKNFK